MARTAERVLRAKSVPLRFLRRHLALSQVRRPLATGGRPLLHLGTPDPFRCRQGHQMSLGLNVGAGWAHTAKRVTGVSLLRANTPN